MRRNPSIKQQFIKKYAKLVYGPEATSNALKGPEAARERAMLKHLFEARPDNEYDYLKYIAWVSENIFRICEYEGKGKMMTKFDTTKPGPFLLHPYFFDNYYHWAMTGNNLPV